MSDPFSLAVQAGLAKQYALKKYLMEVEGLSEEEADARLAELSTL